MAADCRVEMMVEFLLYPHVIPRDLQLLLFLAFESVDLPNAVAHTCL